MLDFLTKKNKKKNEKKNRVKVKGTHETRVSESNIYSLPQEEDRNYSQMTCLTCLTINLPVSKPFIFYRFFIKLYTYIHL